MTSSLALEGTAVPVFAPLFGVRRPLSCTPPMRIALRLGADAARCR